MRPLLQWESKENYAFWVCVFVVLGIQHAMRMGHNVTCDPSSSIIFFPIISQTARLSGKGIAHVCFDFLYNFCLKTFLILRRNERDMIKICIGFHVKYRLCLSEFKETWIFWTFSKNHPVSNLVKIRPVGAELLHVDTHTHRHGEANSRFSRFVWRA